MRSPVRAGAFSGGCRSGPGGLASAAPDSMRDQMLERTSEQEQGVREDAVPAAAAVTGFSAPVAGFAPVSAGALAALPAAQRAASVARLQASAGNAAVAAGPRCHHADRRARAAASRGPRRDRSRRSRCPPPLGGPDRTRARLVAVGGDGADDRRGRTAGRGAGPA